MNEPISIRSQRLLAMIRKEFSQLSHDWPILFILLWGFSGAIYVAGHAISMEIKNYPLVVYDLSKSQPSRDLLSRLNEPNFKLVGYVETEQQWIDALDAGVASLAVIIPPDFERGVAEGAAQFQIISDGTLSMSATIAAAHISRITYGYNIEMIESKIGNLDRVTQSLPQVDARARIQFNPNANSAWFTSLLEMLNMITMVSMLLTAAAVVREKTHGTIEQLLVSPLLPSELYAAKIVPTIVLVVVLSIFALTVVVQGVFGTPIRGSLLLFYSVTIVYCFSVASLGIAIAVIARNISQAMMLLLLILFPMLFLSGATTPPESMSPWMRYLSLISPMRYYIDFGYQVLFKGNGIMYVWKDIVGIVLLGIVMFRFSMWRYQRLLG